MSNSVIFGWFIQSLTTEQKEEYREMSINQQKDWYIKYLESHYGNK